MSAKFIEGPYAAAMYSKKKIGIGKSGSGAFLFITPRAGEEFDDDLRCTAQLMKCAPEMYEMLANILEVYEMHRGDTAAVLKLLAKARGEA